MVFTDKAGVKVAPGDFIIYGHALGRCAGLRYGKVLALVPHPKSYFGCEQKAGDRECRLRIIGVNDDWSHHPPQLLSKSSIIGFGSRILKLVPEQVPENIANLLVNYKINS